MPAAISNAGRRVWASAVDAERTRYVSPATNNMVKRRTSRGMIPPHPCGDRPTDRAFHQGVREPKICRLVRSRSCRARRWSRRGRAPRRAAPSVPRAPVRVVVDGDRLHVPGSYAPRRSRPCRRDDRVSPRRSSPGKRCFRVLRGTLSSCRYHAWRLARRQPCPPGEPGRGRPGAEARGHEGRDAGGVAGRGPPAPRRD